MPRITSTPTAAAAKNRAACGALAGNNRRQSQNGTATHATSATASSSSCALCVVPPGILLTRWFHRVSHVAALRGANPDRDECDGAARRVRGRHGRDPGVQPRAGLPGRVRRPERRQPARQCPTSRRSTPSSSRRSSCSGRSRRCPSSSRAPCFIDAGSLGVGTLIAAVGLLALVFQPLQELSELYGQVQAASAAMDKISSVLDAEIDVADKPGRESESGGSTAASSSTGSPSPTAPSRSCTGSSSRCPPAAASRSSGSQAAASRRPAKLIARFFDPDEGAVRVDGTDLRDVELVGYRRQLGVVLQDPFLFSGTIADNIRFGKPDASDEEVRATAAARRRRPRRRPARPRSPARRARGRRRPLRRRAAADLDRPGAARRPAHPHPR